jgi:rhodanese-related sulfurtransferase
MKKEVSYIGMKQSEHAIQVSYFDWVHFMENTSQDYKNIIAIPNAGKRSYGAANYMKKEGLTAGFPDVFGFVPRGRWHGFAMEFKSEGGTLSKLQAEWLNRLGNLGYAAVVVRSLDEAMKFTKMYMEQ